MRGESEGLSEEAMKAYHTGLPGLEERVGDMPETKDQVELSEELTADEAVDRILAESDEGIDSAILRQALAHMSHHIREAEPETVSPTSLLGGQRPDAMYFVPPQVGDFNEHLVAAGFSVERETERGITVKQEDGTTTTFFYDREGQGEKSDENASAEEESDE